MYQQKVFDLFRLFRFYYYHSFWTSVSVQYYICKKKLQKIKRVRVLVLLYVARRVIIIRAGDDQKMTGCGLILLVLSAF